MVVQPGGKEALRLAGTWATWACGLAWMRGDQGSWMVVFEGLPLVLVTVRAPLADGRGRGGVVISATTLLRLRKLH